MREKYGGVKLENQIGGVSKVINALIEADPRSLGTGC